MPTRTTTVYYVELTCKDDGHPTRRVPELRERYLDRDKAVRRMRDANYVIRAYRPRVRWIIVKATEEVTPDIPDMTDEELRQAWREYGELDRMDKQHDWMEVADPFINFPGDMEMYSDYYGEVAQEYTRRDESRCIVHDTLNEED